MLRTQFHSVWRALNLALLLVALAVTTFSTVWLIQDSAAERERQALQFQQVVKQALELGKGNVKSLQPLLNALPAAPVFEAIEIHNKTGRLLESRYDTREDIGLPSILGSTAPVVLLLDERSGLQLHYLPSNRYLSQRLNALLPLAFLTWLLSLIVVNVMGWSLKNRLQLGLEAKSRWSEALAKPEGLEPVSQAPVAPASTALLDCLPFAVVRCQPDGLITYLNDAARQWLHPRYEEQTPKPLLDMIVPWDKHRCQERLLRTASPGTHEVLDTQLIDTRYGMLPVTIHFMPGLDDSKEWLLLIEDARRERSQQEMLHLREQLLEALPTGMAILSGQDNGEVLYCNETFKRLLNVSEPILQAGIWLDHLGDQVSAAQLKQLRAAISGMSPAMLELVCHAADGVSRTLVLKIIPIPGSNARLACTVRDYSEESSYRKRMEQDNWERRLILDEMPIGLCITDETGKIRRVNATFAELTACAPEKLVGSCLGDWIPELAQASGAAQRGEHTLQAGHQHQIVKMSTRLLLNPEGDKQFAYFFEDISAFRQQARADALELERLQQTLNGIVDGIITTNEDGFIQYMNPYAQKLTGLAEHQYKGIAFAQLIHLVDEKKHEPLVDPGVRAMRIGKVVKFRQDVLFIKDNKQELAVEISASPVFDPQRRVIGAVIVMKDVAEQHSLSQQMQLRASRDPLTGLINRRELLAMLEGLQYEVEEKSMSHTLCYMDLDKFKVVNDSCGHNAGDELLRQVSRLMTDQLRTTDVLARIGGDEFCAVLYNTAPDNGKHVAEKIREAVKAFRFTWEDKFFEIGVSIGLFGLQPGLGVEDTISAADHACYHAKEAGRDLVYIATSADVAAEKTSMTPWHERLTNALEHDYFRLFRLDAETLDAKASLPAYYEIVLKLHEPQQAPLVASAFMPNAHRHNLGGSIERWVIGKLFSILGDYTLTQDAAAVFAIHLSAVTLMDNGFFAFIAEQSQRHGVDPRQVCFEFAEDDVVQNFSVVQQFMTASHALGYRFCLTRFGGGVSSFAYLRNLPLAFLKIDKSLMHNLVDDPIAGVIVRAIKTIAELKQIRIISQDQALRNTQAEQYVDYLQKPSSQLVAL